MTNNGEVLRWAGIEGKGGQTCIAPACYIHASFPALMNSRLPCLSWKTRNHAHAISFSIDSSEAVAGATPSRSPGPGRAHSGARAPPIQMPQLRDGLGFLFGTSGRHLVLTKKAFWVEVRPQLMQKKEYTTNHKILEKESNTRECRDRKAT
ncbi:hypothetical protein AAC387_Pa06g0219 [Persea americana]